MIYERRGPEFDAMAFMKAEYWKLAEKRRAKKDQPPPPRPEDRPRPDNE